MPFGRKSPLEALALPGVILAYKYSQFRQRRREAASRRVTERELSALHHKIVLYPAVSCKNEIIGCETITTRGALEPALS
uniref:Uncharacterized protein n=1 Tax=Glossina morsitans morsitans TaxID=37546 RepID=A0A1B0FLJ7_GLOMM